MMQKCVWKNQSSLPSVPISHRSDFITMSYFLPFLELCVNRSIMDSLFLFDIGYSAGF